MSLVIIRMVSLKSLHGCYSHHGSEIWVFSVGLLSAAPPRISEDIDVRSPEGQSVILLVQSLAYGIVILGTRLIRHICEGLKVGLGIECGSHTDRLRIYGSKTGPCNAVKSLVPPVIIRNTESLDSF